MARGHTGKILGKAPIGLWLLLTGCGAAPEEENIAQTTSPLVRQENRAMALGGGHTCVILSTGIVKCWGRNDRGQLGLGHTNARGDGLGEMGGTLNRVSLGTGRTAIALAAGDMHTCALLNNNQVKCWGSNEWGQLGIGASTTSNRGDAPGEMGDNLPQVNLGSGRWARAIGAGFAFTCALLDNNQIKCWGINTRGALGLGLSENTTPYRTTPSTSPSSGQVSFGTGRSVKAFTLGSYHGCAILNDNQLKCWGGGYLGQLGLGDSQDRGNDPNELGNFLPVTPLGMGRTVLEVDAAGHHTCAVLDNGIVKCWGWNGDGELGLGDTIARGDSQDEMGDALPNLFLPAGSWSHISGGRGDLGHSCILGHLGQVICWGPNWYGNLGLGVPGEDSTRDWGDEPFEYPEWYTMTSGASAISIGQAHTCATMTNGSLKCWGLNDSGQLGLGHTNNIGDDSGETGSALPTVTVGN